MREFAEDEIVNATYDAIVAGEPEAVAELAVHLHGPALDECLVTAALTADREIVRVLLSAGANPNGTERGGHSILAETLSRGVDVAGIELLLEAGADPNRPGEAGGLPLTVAIEHLPAAIDTLLAAGADPNRLETRTIPGYAGGSEMRSVPHGPVLQAFDTGVGMLHRLIESGGSVERAFPPMSLLMLAAENCLGDRYDYLVARGLRDESVAGNLRLAASAGLVDAVAELLRSEHREAGTCRSPGGTGVDEPDEHGRTALAMAVIADRPRLVSLLLDHGADPDQIVRWRWTDSAPAGRRDDFPGNHHDADGRPLIHAARSTRIAGLLIAAGADVDAVHGSSPGALFTMVARHDRDLLETLLGAGARPDVRDERGRTPLHAACAEGLYQAARLLLTHGADPAARDRFGATPLHAIGAPTIVHLLLGHGAELDAADASGTTPLMSACEEGAFDVVIALLTAGADVDRRDHAGQRAIDYAREALQEEISRVSGGVSDIATLKLIIAALQQPEEVVP